MPLKRETGFARKCSECGTEFTRSVVRGRVTTHYNRLIFECPYCHGFIQRFDHGLRNVVTVEVLVYAVRKE